MFNTAVYRNFISLHTKYLIPKGFPHGLNFNKNLYRKLSLQSSSRTLCRPLYAKKACNIHSHGEKPNRDWYQIRCVSSYYKSHEDKHQIVKRILKCVIMFLGGGLCIAVYRFYANDSDKQAQCEEVKTRNLNGEHQDSWQIPKKNSGDSGNKRLTIDEAIEKSRDIAQRIKDETGSPGLIIAVSVDGKEVWSEGFGYADVENRLPCTPDTVLRIASISKPITMVAVARLLEIGDLDLDKSVQFYVPAFPEKMVDGEKVTLTTRHLVSHLSGIRNYSKDYMNKENKNQTNKEANDIKEKSDKNMENTLSKVADSPKSDKNSKNSQAKVAENNKEVDMAEFHIKKHYNTVTDALSMFKDDPLVHKPGTKYLYTTHGYTLLSAVVESIAKKPFDKILRELFREMGMHHTYLDENDPLIYNRGRHYVKNKRGRLVNAPYVDLSYKWAGGGLLSNVHDVVKFGDIMLYSYQNRKYSTEVHYGKNLNRKTNREVDDGKKLKVGKNDNNEIDAIGEESVKKLQINNHSHEDKVLPGILKPETVEMLWTAVEKTDSEDKERSYGMGWELVTEKKEFGKCQNRRFYPYHTGGALGGSSVVLILPPESEDFDKGRPLPHGICVAILTNMVSVGLTKTAFEVAALFENSTEHLGETRTSSYS